MQKKNLSIVKKCCLVVSLLTVISILTSCIVYPPLYYSEWSVSGRIYREIDGANVLPKFLTVELKVKEDTDSVTVNSPASLGEDDAGESSGEFNVRIVGEIGQDYRNTEDTHHTLKISYADNESEERKIKVIDLDFTDQVRLHGKKKNGGDASYIYHLDVGDIYLE